MKKAIRTGLAMAFVMAVTLTSCKDKEAETEMDSEMDTEMTTETTETMAQDTMMTTADSVSVDAPGTTGGNMEQVP